MGRIWKVLWVWIVLRCGEGCAFYFGRFGEIYLLIFFQIVIIW